MFLPRCANSLTRMSFVSWCALNLFKTVRQPCANKITHKPEKKIQKTVASSGELSDLKAKYGGMNAHATVTREAIITLIAAGAPASSPVAKIAGRNIA